MKTTEHKGSDCPGCGKTLDASSQPSGGKGKPEEGDASMCLYCGQPCRYRADLSLEALSTQDLAKLFKAHPDFELAYEALQQHIKERDDEDNRVPNRQIELG